MNILLFGTFLEAHTILPLKIEHDEVTRVSEANCPGNAGKRRSVAAAALLRWLHKSNYGCRNKHWDRNEVVSPVNARTETDKSEERRQRIKREGKQEREE